MMSFQNISNPQHSLIDIDDSIFDNNNFSDFSIYNNNNNLNTFFGSSENKLIIKIILYIEKMHIINISNHYLQNI